MPVVAEFPRSLAWSTSGAFLSYGPQQDLDAAFDEAALTDQFDLGTLGFTPSLQGVDPAAVQASDEPVHPHLALRQALRELPTMEPGEVRGQAVRALKDFTHSTLRLTLEDPSLAYPLEPGPLWAHDSIIDAVAQAAPSDLKGVVVSALVPRPGSRKYAARAVAYTGPKVTTFGVFNADGVLLSEHASASLARKDALLLARDKSRGAGTWDIRPIVRRPDGMPFVRVERALVACKVPVVAQVAIEKEPIRETVHGWLFYGRAGDLADL